MQQRINELSRAVFVDREGGKHAKPTSRLVKEDAKRGPPTKDCKGKKGLVEGAFLAKYREGLESCEDEVGESRSQEEISYDLVEE